jgi:hypothetical protein
MRNLFTIIALVLTVACGTKEIAAEKYSIQEYFEKDQQDSLLVDIITYIYKKPKYADHQTRFDEQYRNYYSKMLSKFEMVYFYQHVSDSYHYYYLIRPARSPKGTTRGVGGRFLLNENNEIIDFEEIFNTPVQPVEELKKRGLFLFEEMIATGSIESYLGNENFIEWPDNRLKYDKATNEWRYNL